MRWKWMRRAVAGVSVGTLLAAGNVQAFAAAVQPQQTSEVRFDGRYEGGFTVEAQDNNLFAGMKELMPGAMVKNTVNIRNNSSQSLTFYVKAYPDYTAVGDGASRDGGPVVTEAGKTFMDGLLDMIKMNITTEGGIYLYGNAGFTMPASAKGTEFETNDYGITIGAVPAKSSRTLTITIKLPGPEMGNEYADTFDAVDWVFYVEGTEGGSEPGNEPGGSGGTGNSSGGPGVITISEGEVPLAPGGGPGDVNIVIDEDAIPLDALAKTGGPVLYLRQAASVLALLLGGLAVTAYARKKQDQS